jgi:hypothetical protein
MLSDPAVAENLKNYQFPMNNRSCCCLDALVWLGARDGDRDDSASSALDSGQRTLIVQPRSGQKASTGLETDGRRLGVRKRTGAATCAGSPPPPFAG